MQECGGEICSGVLQLVVGSVDQLVGVIDLLKECRDLFLGDLDPVLLRFLLVEGKAERVEARVREIVGAGHDVVRDVALDCHDPLVAVDVDDDPGVTDLAGAVLEKHLRSDFGLVAQPADRLIGLFAPRAGGVVDVVGLDLDRVLLAPGEVVEQPVDEDRAVVEPVFVRVVISGLIELLRVFVILAGGVRRLFVELGVALFSEVADFREGQLDDIFCFHSVCLLIVKNF